MSTERSSTGLDGLFRELRSLVDRLGTESEVADINKTTRFGSKDGVDGIASVQVRTIIGGSDTPDSASTAVSDVRDSSAKNDKAEHNESVRPTREPNVDILDESGRIILIAEMPGVSEAAVSCIVNGDTVRLEGIGPRARYVTVRRLPRSMADAKVEIRARHGVVEVTIAGDGA
jgi:HSP20 family molecular chaperone IbpA